MHSWREERKASGKIQKRTKIKVQIRRGKKTKSNTTKQQKNQIIYRKEIYIRCIVISNISQQCSPIENLFRCFLTKDNIFVDCRDAFNREIVLNIRFSLE